MSTFSKNPVALITGSTSGIGLALAKIFAKHHYDLILVARDEKTLRKISGQLNHEFQIRIEIIAQDLSHQDGAEVVFKRTLEFSDKVDVLVNNAGFGIHGAFKDAPIEKESELVNLQLLALLKLTKLFLPGMIKAKKGHFLNVASVYALAPVPFQAVYGACKAFMLSFSEALRPELEPFGIKVTVVCPGSTRTAFRMRAGIAEKSPTSGMSAEDVAAAAFEGFRKGREIVIPGTINKFFMNVIKWIPRSRLAKTMIMINKARGVIH